MQSRRDQVQAHMFVMGRVTSGVLRLEPDGLDQPVSRTTRGALAGLAVAVLAAVVVALYGFIVPGGNTSWQKPGTLVVVKDSGARYLSIGGVLHPVLNLTSAKLLAGDQLAVQDVSAHSIGQAPRGAPIGLVGAPDALPAATALTGGAWTACGTRSQDDTGAITAQLALSVGATPAGEVLGSSQAVPVAGPDGNDYLLWNGERLRISSSHNVLQAIGDAGADLPLVAASFLDVVPAGPDLAAPQVSGRGRRGPELAGQRTRLGQLFTDGSGNRYVLTDQGLVALTPTLFALITADPQTQSQAYAKAAVTVTTLGPTDLAAHLAPASATAALTRQGTLPATVPTLQRVSMQQGVCEQIRPGGGLTTSTMIVTAGALGGSVPDREPGVTPSCLPADSVAVSPGGGALVQATLAGGAPGAAYFLVTDGGVKFPVPSSDALSALGYGAVPAAVLPADWLDLLPTGPTLTTGAVGAGASVQAAPAGGCVVAGAPAAGSVGPAAGHPAAGNPGGNGIRGQPGRTNGHSGTEPLPPAGSSN